MGFVAIGEFRLVLETRSPWQSERVPVVSRCRWCDERQQNPEFGSTARSLFDGDSSAVHLDRPLGDGQAQPGAPAIARSCLVHPEEAIEDARAMLGRDAWSFAAIASTARSPARATWIAPSSSRGWICSRSTSRASGPRRTRTTAISWRCPDRISERSPSPARFIGGCTDSMERIRRPCGRFLDCSRCGSLRRANGTPASAGADRRAVLAVVNRARAHQFQGVAAALLRVVGDHNVRSSRRRPSNEVGRREKVEARYLFVATALNPDGADRAPRGP